MKSATFLAQTSELAIIAYLCVPGDICILTDAIFNLYFQVFQGNVDLETVVQHSLKVSTQARYVRLYPVTHSTWSCMGIELFVR